MLRPIKKAIPVSVNPESLGKHRRQPQKGAVNRAGQRRTHQPQGRGGQQITQTDALEHRQRRRGDAHECYRDHRSGNQDRGQTEQLEAAGAPGEQQELPTTERHIGDNAVDPQHLPPPVAGVRSLSQLSVTMNRPARLNP